MRISHKHKFVFISKPRCATTSLRKALDPYSEIMSCDHLPYHHHTTASLLKEHFESKGWDWNSYFKFVCVRNPWDMLVSAYFYGKPDRNNLYRWQQTPKTAPAEYNPENLMPFKEWLVKGKTWCLRRNNSYKDMSLRSLSYYALDKEQKFLVDYVIRVEHLEEDLKRLGSILGLAFQVPKLNGTRHNHYSKYYDTESRERVEQIFSYDIAYGQYEF